MTEPKLTGSDRDSPMTGSNVWEGVEHEIQVSVLFNWPMKMSVGCVNV